MNDFLYSAFDKQRLRSKDTVQFSYLNYYYYMAY